MDKIILKKGRDESLKRFHPWVFSGAVAEISGNPAEGDLVGVFSHEGEYLASGHYQIGSIAVRILSFDADPSSPDFYNVLISRALGVRKAAGLVDSSNTTCYRLVHGEGDSLPGLIVDYYDGVCVMQAHSAGMFRARKQIAQALREVYGGSLKAVYDKSSSTAPYKAGLDLVDGYLYKAPGFEDDRITVLEYGNRFNVDWTQGQKTGFFLDQRENRRLVSRYASGKEVLNLFCYTGGFSVYALSAGASHVDSVDSSAKAMAMLEENIALNGFDPSTHKGYCADAIDFLKDSPEGKYNLMIVDPPAFAKHRGALSNALRAYRRLNAAAIARVAPGGVVFTFSCSQVVDKEAFALAVFSAAAETGRSVRILDRLNQPADHAVNIYHPEGEYLKGLALYVE
ncbi:MAG: class I SAM-dependent rRNA methyltransferase [Bacteroidales bacterium]|nr:class I SAM-dependent rRNA methyltransferase [Bacteroidales bacterium]